MASIALTTSRWGKSNRLSSVAAKGYWFEYDYLENSTTDRLHKTRAPFIKETEWIYEPGRDTITSVTNHVGFQLDQQLSQYAYENNADAQRTTRTSQQAGQEWTDHFSYDPDTGGITASNPDTEEREPESYQYDKIGNRLKATQGTQTTSYEANALNQYKSIQSSSPSSLATRPSFDLDGNHTQEGNRTYTWDAENRLIAIQEGSTVIAKYTYDHQSRRIARWVNNGTDERYLYDGWNLIAVYQKGQTKPVETYTWGKDLSGTLQGAGGVGGLLFARTQGADPNTWIYHYDANGNVTQITDPRGKLLEQNTYDSFGKATTESQIRNRYRFSTKPQDRESGFNYYGYRYYNPAGGRWLSEDPIGVTGGKNLYGFVANRGTNTVDILGRNALDNILSEIESVFEGFDAAESYGIINVLNTFSDLSVSYRTDRQTELDSLNAAAAWAFNDDEMWFGSTPTISDAGIVLHEYVHAYNDINSTSAAGIVTLTHIDTSADEGMAYAIQYTYTHLEILNSLKENLEQQFADQSAGDPSCDNIRTAVQSIWPSSWALLTDSGVEYLASNAWVSAFPLLGAVFSAHSNQSRTIGPNDYQSLSNHLGVLPDCDSMANLLNGLPVMQACCIEVSCEESGTDSGRVYSGLTNAYSLFRN